MTPHNEAKAGDYAETVLMPGFRRRLLPARGGEEFRRALHDRSTLRRPRLSLCAVSDSLVTPEELTPAEPPVVARRLTRHALDTVTGANT
ncbi:MAG TPA: hypothetical protein VFB16_12910 [Bauldia sp.]|nr:hypothetical protein [Bauldia sp.]